MKLPVALHPLFWDYRCESIDSDAHAPLVLERVLEYGSLHSVRWALDAYGADRIREFLCVRGARALSRKTLSLWPMLLDLEGPRLPPVLRPRELPLLVGGQCPQLLPGQA